MLVCHLPYSIQQFSIYGEYEYAMSIEVPTLPKPSSAPRVHKQDTMFCLPCSYKNESIEICLFLCYHMIVIYSVN